MSKHSASRVKTFSVGYDAESGYDESKYAEQIANYLGLEHRTIFPKYRSQDLNESIDHILDHIDQPYANPTVMLTSLLTATVRNEVKVALIGDGADELFGGYPRHWAIGIQSKFGPIVRTLRRPLIASLNLIPETPKGNHLARRFRRFCNSSNSDLAITYEESTRLFTSIELNSITSYSRCGESGNRTFLADLFRDAQGSPLVRACSADQRSFLTNNLLDGADRLSMANGFELRLPFLDRALMEFAATLPADYRIRGRVQKRVLKDAYRGKLPETVFNRAKRGFNPPVWHWLKGSRSMLGQLSSRRSPLADYINPAATHRMLERFDANLEDNSTQLWALLVLERWLTRRN